MLTEGGISDRLQASLARSGDSAVEYSEIEITKETQVRCAAVLIPLVQEEGAWHILYTRRTQRVESHKGQVSFPGGACDQDETSPEATALREVEEEIGVGREAIRILGRLASMVTITGYRITPVVGVLDWPVVFRLSEHEVERIFTVPLAWLSDPRNRWELPFPGSPRGIVVYHPYDGELVWGATARMTLDFVNTIGLRGI
jgi:8-oxo-dGTP pyrophosphatase MutT (NUDIX family)